MHNVLSLEVSAFSLIPKARMAPKRPHEGQEVSVSSRKKQKTTDARVIRFQSGPNSGGGIITDSKFDASPTNLTQLNLFK